MQQIPYQNYGTVQGHIEIHNTDTDDSLHDKDTDNDNHEKSSK